MDAGVAVLEGGQRACQHAELREVQLSLPLRLAQLLLLPGRRRHLEAHRLPKRLVIEPPWVRFSSDCRRCWHPPRLNNAAAATPRLIGGCVPPHALRSSADSRAASGPLRKAPPPLLVLVCS
eukprot:COSAG01_NODE_11658_length_1886_cov_2.736989_3_plen_122_part_00